MKDIQVNNYYKFDLKDARIEKPDGKRALIVDLEMSASGKVTNGRIYPPTGHRAGLSSWTKPYGKPMITHHEEGTDAIGRCIGAEWQDLEKEALGFLGGNYQALADIKRAFESNNPKSIYDTMRKYNAFDKKWPGLGRVVGKFRIPDVAVQQKFVDEIYLTCSAGQGTDAYICMSCGSDWHKGQICDHQSGTTDEDGNPVYFLCGTMTGRELSMVNSPANDTSLTLSMSFADDNDNKVEMSMKATDAIQDATVIVPKVSFEETSMNLKDLQALEPKTVLSILADDQRLAEFIDALKGDSHYEVNWLIRIHDALHYEYDMQLKYRDPNGDEKMPSAVYKLHGAIHDTSMAKGFRDSMINGELDHYDSTGVESDEYVMDSAVSVKHVKLTDSDLATIVSLLQQAMEKKNEQPAAGDKEEEEKEKQVELLEQPAPAAETPAQPADEEQTEDYDPEVDWYTLDLALDAMMGDAKLSTEKRKELPAKTFCGPDRSFPVPDCAHVTAARRLIGRYKGPGSKDSILACVNRRAKSLGCDADAADSAACKCTECKCGKDAKLTEKYNDIKQDYINALMDLERTKESFASALKQVSKKLRPQVDISGAKLDALIDWFDNIDFEGTSSTDSQDKSKPTLELKPTESPNVNVEDHTVSDSKLSQFAQTVVKKYNTILNDKEMGEAQAEAYLRRMSQYLPPDFNIKNHISK